MGGVVSSFETSRQKQFNDICAELNCVKPSELKVDKENVQMSCGRVSAPYGILMAPLSMSPCVAYSMEIAEVCFTGDIFSKHRGYGWKNVFSEKKSLAFEIIDPSSSGERIFVSAFKDYTSNTPRPQRGPDTDAVEMLTDVVVAHVQPNYKMSYDIPYTVGGDIQATRNLIRGYPFRFGGMDGDGLGKRMEIPENVKEIFTARNIALEENGKTKIFAILETSLRVNDQVNILATFDSDAENPVIRHAKPIRLHETTRSGKSGKFSGNAEKSPQFKGAISRVLKNQDSIIITRFPRLMTIDPLSKTLIFTQEKGMSSFALGEHALNAKDKRLKDALASANSHEYLHHHSSNNVLKHSKSSKENLGLAKAGLTDDGFTDLRNLHAAAMADDKWKANSSFKKSDKTLSQEGLVLSSFTAPKPSSQYTVPVDTKEVPIKPMSGIPPLGNAPQIVSVSRKYANESPRSVDNMANMSVTSEFR